MFPVYRFAQLLREIGPLSSPDEPTSSPAIGTNPDVVQRGVGSKGKNWCCRADLRARRPPSAAPASPSRAIPDVGVKRPRPLLTIDRHLPKKPASYERARSKQDCRIDAPPRVT